MEGDHRFLGLGLGLGMRFDCKGVEGTFSGWSDALGLACGSAYMTPSWSAIAKSIELYPKIKLEK